MSNGVFGLPRTAHSHPEYEDADTQHVAATDPHGDRAAATAADAAHVTALHADSGWLTSGYAMGADWTDSGVQYRKIGGLVFVRLRVARANSAIAGNFADNTVLTLPAGYRPAIQTYGIGYSPNAAVMMGMAIETSGVITAQATDSGATVNIGNSIQASFSFPAA